MRFLSTCKCRGRPSILSSSSISSLFNNLHVCNLRCIRKVELPVPSLWLASNTAFVLRVCSTPAIVFISVRLERGKIVFNNMVQGRDCLLVCLSLSFTPVISYDSVNPPPVDYGLCCGRWHSGYIQLAIVNIPTSYRAQ